MNVLLEAALADLTWAAKRLGGDGMGAIVSPARAQALLAEIARLRAVELTATWTPAEVARLQALTPSDVAAILEPRRRRQCGRCQEPEVETWTGSEECAFGGPHEAVSL